MLNGWLDREPTQGSCENSACQEHTVGDEQTMSTARNSNSPKSEPIQKGHMKKNHQYTTSAVEVNSPGENGLTGLYDAVCKGHDEMVKILLEGGASVHKLDARGLTPKALAVSQGNKSKYDLLHRYEQRRIEKPREIDFDGPEIVGTSKYSQNKTGSHAATEYLESHSRRASADSMSNPLRYHKDRESTKKRVTIHMQVPTAKTSTAHLSKLIILPSSTEELLRVAGKPQLICNKLFISLKADISIF